MSDDNFEDNSGGSGRDDTWVDVRKLIAAYTRAPERDSESEEPITRALDQDG